MVQFSKGTITDIDQLKKIWLSSFNDTQQGCEYFFENMFLNSTCYIAKKQEKIVSALYLIPVLYKKHQSHYLYAAATLPNYRSMGIMKLLISFALEDSERNGDEFSFLLPANNTLYDYYKRFGYIDNCSISTLTLSCQEIKDKLSGFSFNLQENNQQDYYSISMKNTAESSLIWNQNQIEYAMDYYKIYGGDTVNVNGGYAIISDVYEKTVKVSQFICSKEKEPELLYKILQTKKADKYTFCFNSAVKEFLSYKTKKIVYGMSKKLNDKNIEKDIYLGLTFE